jgi:hypothetical protein
MFVFSCAHSSTSRALACALINNLWMCCVHGSTMHASLCSLVNDVSWSGVRTDAREHTHDHVESLSRSQMACTTHIHTHTHAHTHTHNTLTHTHTRTHAHTHTHTHTGLVYFMNTKTRHSQWRAPPDFDGTFVLCDDKTGFIASTRLQARVSGEESSSPTHASHAPTNVPDPSLNASTQRRLSSAAVPSLT